MHLHEYLSSENISAKEFADRLGVTPEAVRMWLKGLRRPSNPQYDVILQKTDGKVTPNDFQPATAPPPDPAEVVKDSAA